MAILVLVHAGGVDELEGVAGEIDIAGFVVDLPACLPEGNVRSQISGPLVGVPFVGASMDGVALGAEVHTVRGRVDVDNAIIKQREVVDAIKDAPMAILTRLR